MNIQLFYNVIVSTAHITLVAIGFALIYRIAGFFNFAHASIYAVGAYVCYLTINLLKSNTVGFLSGVVVSCLLGTLVELFVYKPLRKRGASQLVLLVGSLGIFILIQNGISSIFGDETRIFSLSTTSLPAEFYGIHIVKPQLLLLLLAITTCLFFIAFLRFTRYGIMMRAIGNDPMLANYCGLAVDHMVLLSFFLGSAIAGVAGISWAYNTALSPNMGFTPLILGVVAVIIGGVNSIRGIVFGALLLSVAQHLGSWYIGSQWQDAIAFVILVSFLLFKPEGFFGKKVKSAIV